MEKENYENVEPQGYEDLESHENFTLFKKVWDKDKYNFYEYIAVMLNSGVWMWETLSGVTEKLDNVYFKQKINEMLIFISSWDSLSKAMKKNPSIFGKHEISIIESWETTGSLWKSLESLAMSIRKNDILKKKIKSSLTYPLIIFIFLLSAVVIVLIYVIPSLMPLFENSEAELPMTTKALVATSDFLKNYYLFIIFFLFSGFVFFVWYKSTESWKEKLDNMLLSLPLVWKVYRNYIITNISSSMWNLIWSWVSTIKVLKLVWKSSGSYIYEQLFNEIMKKVESWQKIVESMRAVDEDKFYFPNSYLQMLAIWEKTANMEEINLKIVDQYSREVDYSLSNLTKWIEPLAIVIAALFVLWFAFAVFGAILQVTQAVW